MTRSRSGEIFTASKIPAINIEARGTDAITKVEIEVDGKTAKAFACSGQDQKLTYQPDGLLAGQHIFYVKLEQEDGNHAWASPLWVEIK